MFGTRAMIETGSLYALIDDLSKMKDRAQSASILIGNSVEHLLATRRKSMEEREDNYLHLPDLGEVDEVTIVEWLKGEGESFSLGDDLVEVETEKTTFIVDAPAAGRIERILRNPGEKARLGDRLAELAS